MILNFVSVTDVKVNLMVFVILLVLCPEIYLVFLCIYAMKFYWGYIWNILKFTKVSETLIEMVNMFLSFN